MNKQELIDIAIERIKQDVKEQDFTAIDELLQSASIEKLVGYVAEDKIDKLFEQGEIKPSIK